MTKKEIAKILLKIDAVKVSLVRPFKYDSGLLSPIYTNCRILSSHMKELKKIIDQMIVEIKHFRKNIDLIACAGTSSIFLGSILSQRIKIPMIYIRSKSKMHGKKKEIEGVFKNNSRVLLVSDIVSTERDIPNSVEAIKKSGGKVIHCVAIFSNDIGIIESFLKKKNIPLTVLTDLPTLLEAINKEEKVSEEEKSMIKDWIKNKDKWDYKRRMDLLELFKNTEKKVAKILLSIGAITINFKEPFKYASGILSPIYVDNRLLISYPNKWKDIIDIFINYIIYVIGLENFDILAGMTTSGIPHATLIADRLELPIVYVKLKSKDKLNRGLIEGKFKNKDRVVIIEDHITTGKSVIDTAKILRNHGALINWCITIFSYNMKRSKLLFDKEKIKLISLCNILTLIEVAKELDYIDEESEKSLVDWLDDPDGWREENKNSYKASS